MISPALSLIQNTDGTERIHFERLFDRCEIGTSVEKLLSKIWNYINYYSDISEEQEIKFLEILKTDFQFFKVDRNVLIKNKNVDKLVLETVVEEIETVKNEKKIKQVTWIDNSGFYYFVFGMSDKQILEKLKHKILKIDARFFERSKVEKPSLINQFVFKIRKVLNVCKI